VYFGHSGISYGPHGLVGVEEGQRTVVVMALDLDLRGILLVPVVKGQSDNSCLHIIQLFMLLPVILYGNLGLIQASDETLLPEICRLKQLRLTQECQSTGVNVT
jgi:hypothetical protein